MNAELKQSGGIAWGVTERIGRIVLTRGERANSLTRAACRALVTAIDEVLDQGPRVVLLSAEGRIFCSGGDIDEFASAGENLDTLVDEILLTLHPALLRLATASVPVVAAVNGPIGGAGIGLALCGDFVLAAESMKLRTGYAAIGLSPDLGASYFLARRIGAVRAQQWLMLSESIDAQDCLAHGAVDALYTDAELSNAAERLAQRLAKAASGSLASIKELCNGLPERDLASHLELEHRFLLACARTSDARKGIAAFLERRSPGPERGSPDR